MKHNNKLTLSKGRFDVEDLPPELEGRSGLVSLPGIVDFTVGEEVCLHWIDRTPFIKEIAAQKPLKFFCHGGIYITSFGPVIWFLFYIPPGSYCEEPLASMEVTINPKDPLQMSLWDRLANQTHVHLVLVGERNQVHGFYEYENNFRIEQTLETYRREFRGFEVTDFIKAKEEFFNRYTLKELYDLGAAPPKATHHQEQLELLPGLENVSYVSRGAFGGGVSIHIERVPELGHAWAAVVNDLPGSYGYSADKPPTKRPLNTNQVRALSRALQETRIPLMPSEITGLDGSTYEITIKGFGGSVSLSWSEHSSPEWKALSKIFVFLGLE